MSQTSQLSLEQAIVNYAEQLAECDNPNLQMPQMVSFVKRLVSDLKFYYTMKGRLDGLLQRDDTIIDNNEVKELTKIVSEKHEQMIAFFMFLAPEEAQVA